MGLPAEGAYFNCGVMLMNLDELRKQDFFERAVEFLNRKSAYRFWDQSAINFLLYGQIDELPEYWNRASWRFDAQQNNDLNCVLHYTAQRRGSVERRVQLRSCLNDLQRGGLACQSAVARFQKSARQIFWQMRSHRLRALSFPIRIVVLQNWGQKAQVSCLSEIARYWFDYILNAPRPATAPSRRSEEIQRMKFDLCTSQALAS